MDVVIPYKAKDIVDATINYKSGNNLDYFFNSQEVLAYFSMLDLHNKVDDIMPFLNVSDEIKEIQRKSALDKIKPYLPEND